MTDAMDGGPKTRHTIVSLNNVLICKLKRENIRMQKENRTAFSYIRTHRDRARARVWALVQRYGCWLTGTTATITITIDDIS